MSESQITREILESNELKKIIIRIDYIGVTSIESWIEKLKNSFITEYFQLYSKQSLSNVEFSLTTLRNNSESSSIPIESYKVEPLHLFKEVHFEKGTLNKYKSDVVLEITSEHMAITIDCIEYQEIRPYVELALLLCKALLDFDNYIKIIRLGIRKIGGIETQNFDEIFRIYEKDTLFNKFSEDSDHHMKFIEKSYTDRFLNNELNVKVNYTRLCRPVKKKDKLIYQVLMDRDCYMDSAEILNKEPDYALLLDLINGYSLELFSNAYN